MAVPLVLGGLVSMHGAALLGPSPTPWYPPSALWFSVVWVPPRLLPTVVAVGLRPLSMAIAGWTSGCEGSGP